MYFGGDNQHAEVLTRWPEVLKLIISGVKPYLSAKNPEKYSIQIQLDGYDNLKILIYSLESAIAENFRAILQRFELAGGMTDFYDIYYLSWSFDYNRYKVSDSNLGNTVAKK